MKYATLGNTGLLVSKLCFGTMTFGDGRGMFKVIGAVGQAAADELLRHRLRPGSISLIPRMFIRRVRAKRSSDNR
jgi:aryl-alcohol dehydrogenase-like predicted oxidoreductase